MEILKKYNLFIFIFIPYTIYTQAPKRYIFEHYQMGTRFKITLYSSDSILAQTAINQSIKRIDDLNQVFSDYLQESEISKLSNSAGSGKKVPVSSEMWKVLNQSKKISKRSIGAYDVTIGPLSKLWRSMIRKKEIFNGVKINIAKYKVNYKNLKIYYLSKRIKLLQKGMRLDAGGIAKGFTVDEVVKILNSYGIKQILVDGGGDLFIGDPPPNKTGWKIQISQTGIHGKKEHKEIILKNIAIASSGDTYRFLEWEGKRYSHIIDPRTGYGVIDQKIITVMAPSCMLADVAASALSVLSDIEKKKFLKKVKKVKIITY